MDFKNLPKNIQEDKIDNVVNTALSKAIELKWKLRKEVIDAWDNTNSEEIDEYDKDIISWKKQILDKSWTIDRLLLILDKFKMIDNLAFGEDMIKINCPSCGHEDFAVFLNKDGSVLVNCVGGKCNIGTGDIWQIFGDEGSIETIIDEVWDTLKNCNDSDINKIKNGDYVVKRCSSYANKYLPSIVGNCVEKYNYMYKKGFTKDVLIECDVLYRDDAVNTWNNKTGANEINDFRYRICYVIKDLKGNVVGIQGRSIFDNNIDRERFVKNDEHYKKVYWNSFKYNKDDCAKKRKEEKFKKLSQKVLSTSGFKKSQHLYLAYKYVGMEGIKKVVITEGPKDAIKVYAQKFNDIAVVSSLGKDLSSAQAEILLQVFGTDVEIVMAYDGDEAGKKGNIDAYNRLIKKGFKKVSFVKYKNWKDFGDVIVKTKTAENKIIAGMINNALSFDDYNNSKDSNKVKRVNKTDKKNNNDGKDFWTVQAEEWEKENDTISNGEGLAEPSVAEQITFDANAERTADWFAELIKLAKRESGKFAINIEAEMMNLQENGKEEWFKEFVRRYGDLPYNILLIVAKVEKKIKVREMLLAKFTKQTISVVDDATNDNYIPF
ncbi:toprim domain-containing protein [Haloimpatiens lingqiaonensis]|uniref:toprim domain-containing protein n=1 Tax=Haloimpatiens lingqiaonensis TaxID=1380675 RepID=UPI0010FE9532|nr:toprim domain-containing protein [Haloimpatiens lingqiaonensis]